MIWGYWGDNRGFRGLVDPEGVRSGSVWVRLLKAFLTCTHTHTLDTVLIAFGQVPVYLTVLCV